MVLRAEYADHAEWDDYGGAACRPGRVQRRHAMSETALCHLRIFGRVQGVWYRESMRQQAEQLGITGWVRNRQDGSVEALVQGDPEKVERIIEWARRGPEQAVVSRVDVDEDSPQLARVAAFDSFLKLATC